MISKINFRHEYVDSLVNPSKFWLKKTLKNIDWYKKPTLGYELKSTNINWFEDGLLNISYNCVDRHLPEKENQVAIIWENDDRTIKQKITYRELFVRVNKRAILLKKIGVNKGDVVTIYMSSSPEAIVTMLACTRIGAPHSVVFAGFLSESLRKRIDVSNSKFLVTECSIFRNGKKIKLKEIAYEAVEDMDIKILLFTGEIKLPNNVISVIKEEKSICDYEYIKPEPMKAEDCSFILFTSGSTGTPKGLVHTTGGYLTYVNITFKYVFDYNPGDVFACMADVGWITGHSYIVYGPLSNGGTIMTFSGTPVYPTPDRYWKMIEEYKITQLYTAPTAIRLLMKYGNDFTKKYDLSTLRILGSVGEPINNEAWNWYNDIVGQKKCFIVDTYWQTETGGVICTPLTGIHSQKAGLCVSPFLGIQLILIDENNKRITTENTIGKLFINSSWPGIARTIYKNHERYTNTYFSDGIYDTNDLAMYDRDGDLRILGRSDDEINVSGHRISTAEIENILSKYGNIVESAVIGVDDDIKGQGLCCFCVIKDEMNKRDIDDIIIKNIGKFAKPKHIYFVTDLPKTRSGKIMRRILRKSFTKQWDTLGDLSTLANPKIINELKCMFDT
jgi:acetyl-CoA synthetase